MELTDSARTVLERRYLLRGADGALETPDQLFERVAASVAAADSRYGSSAAEVRATADRFLERMQSLEFLPNSPTLMNAGRPLGQLAACFVVPVADSTDAIFDAVRWAALIQKTGGGTGFSFSRLRPAGDEVASTGGIASGPVSFLSVFDVATEAVKQGGTRRGANMGVLRVDHPDILSFITAKTGGGIRNFNLSVGATDAFMNAAATDTDYDLVSPRTGETVGTLSARHVLEAVATASWATGDPGLVFLDRMNAAQPTPQLGDIEATNPCGEQPLLAFESCTLGSINLGKFVAPEAAAGAADIDWSRLEAAVRDGVHFLDNVIDENRYPLPQIEAATRATRKIGLGVMGFADLLAMLGIPYTDDRAIEVGSEIAAFVERISLDESRRLARDRGPFPAFDGSRWASSGKDPLRNATTTTIAPTGTISIIAGCSSGIEPIYAVAMARRVLDGDVLTELHPGFARRAAAAGILDDALVRRLGESASIQHIDAIPEPLRRLFASAHDVAPEHHVRMQAAFQRHVHAAVSKTVNLANSATVADVMSVYELAFRLGCKGVTVYRDGSKPGQVLDTANSAGAQAGPESGAHRCPECGADTTRFAGCAVCTSCGYSVCGG